MRHLLLLLAFCALTVSCRGSQTKYAENIDKARTAELAGSPQEAARIYERAARVAKSQEDRMEARYLQAQVFRRARHWQRAIFLLKQLGKQYPQSERAARTFLDLARIHERLGSTAQARRAYRQVVEEYPRSGLAETAADGLVRLSDGAASEEYAKLLPQPSAPELDGFLRSRLADALVAEGRKTEAISVLQQLVKLHPLPQGSYSDEALLSAASLRLELGDAKGALETLEVLLEGASERATLLGSYERASYAKARMLEAEIHRDALGDWEAAEKYFARLPQQHPSSRLRDDALWQAAWLARARHRRAHSCRYARNIQALEPPSRFARCLFLVCKRITKPQERGECKSALRRVPPEVRTAAHSGTRADQGDRTTP